MKRSEVPVNLTWDLSLIYKSPEEGWKAADELLALGRKVEEEYKGRLKDTKSIVDCLHICEKMSDISGRVNNYFGLDMETDYSDSEKVANANKASSIAIEAFTMTSFVDSEIIEADSAVLEEAIKIGGSVSEKLRKILRAKAHYLNPETEKALTALEEFMDTPYDVYNQAKLSDMRFDDFTVNGKTYPLGYSLFEDEYEYEADTDVRRAAFRHFSDKIKQYENVTATAYNALVRKEKTLANLRGHKDVFDYLLFEEEVERELYDRQIDVIMEKLAPHMRKYAKLLQKIYKLDKMTYADLKLSVDPDFDPRVSIEEAEKYLADSLAVMGEEYVEMIHKAFKERWIDFATNDGKCTGGFCSSPYGVPASFILLSWQSRMADVFTLAHELGHAGHFKECNAAQGCFDTEVATYFVESPSTINELLLTGYLEKTNPDPRFKRWVLGCTVGKTYYHNFVTHLLEAAYQREVYKLIDAGESVQAETLSEIFKDVLTKFWGDTVELTEGAELTWMRQPHYYMGLYSYTYSAGLTISTVMSRRILNEGAPAVEDWKKALRAGSTVNPMQFAKMAGVDISTDEPLLETIEYIGSLIDEMCELTEQLEA
ncbi:MAG: oligoendopeptidase F [Lachnospiraceae bacterium]|nr:oligoendopeptidase F [Lachnospiraceae bacterium]